MTKILVILAFVGALLYVGVATIGQFEAATAARTAQLDQLLGGAK